MNTENNKKMSYTFPPLLESYLSIYQDYCASLLGWQLVDFEYLKNKVSKHPSDTVGLGSNSLKTLNDSSREKISFSFLKSIGNIINKDLKPNKYLSFLAQMTVGHCWEILSIDYKNKTGNDLRSMQNPVVQFCRHIRNGCFHANKLNITITIKPSGAEWGGIKITNKDNNRQIFANGVKNKKIILDYGDVLLLLCDTSAIINCYIIKKQR
ncbi:MAG: hypothetical protein OEX08_02595 [Candidatus Nomurabacteria bacterium]|nr:hypothetical protein [Candidatus Nomurabacteria bacterium]